MSTPELSNANQIQQSPPPFSQETQVPTPPSTPLAGRSTLSKTTITSDQKSIIQQAFSSEQATNHFLSSYSSNTQFTTLVHKVGTSFIALNAARSSYLRCVKEADHLVTELGNIMPKGPSIESIHRRLFKIDPPRLEESQDQHRPAPDRLSLSPSSPTTPKPEPPPTPIIQHQQPNPVALNNTPTLYQTPPTPHRQTPLPSRGKIEAHQHKYKSSTLVNVME